VSGPVLETPQGLWAEDAFEQAVREVCDTLTEEQVSAGDVLMFPAPLTATSVFKLHAAWQMGAVAMPVPPHATPDERDRYAEAAAQPAGPDIVLRLLTSGTTGTPKIVDLSTQQLEASARASQQRLGCGPEDRWLCCLPLHHIAGISILTRTHTAHATAVLHSRFDPSAVNHAIDHAQVSMLSFVPTMLSRVLDDRMDAPFPRHTRVILLGGAPTPPALLDRCRAIKAPVALTWGMTETASQIATREPGDLRLSADVGHPLPGITVTTENGLLVVEGAIAPGGRWVTSDRGQLDEAGRVSVHGRGGALIISGGENIDPVHIERTLLDHPAVDEAAVIGKPNALWGERPVAFVVGRPTDELTQWLATRLPPPARPEAIHWLEALPCSPMGKVDRQALAQLT
jgi:O-succinylbenzoic acid--CoA ligase